MLCTIHAQTNARYTHHTNPPSICMPFFRCTATSKPESISRSEAMLHDHTVHFLHHSSLPETQTKQFVVHKPLPNNVILSKWFHAASFTEWSLVFVSDHTKTVQTLLNFLCTRTSVKLSPQNLLPAQCWKWSSLACRLATSIQDAVHWLEGCLHWTALVGTVKLFGLDLLIHTHIHDSDLARAIKLID